MTIRALEIDLNRVHAAIVAWSGYSSVTADDRSGKRAVAGTVGAMATDLVRIVMIGAGGHARVCLEALADLPTHLVIGAASNDGVAIDGFGVPMLGLDADLAALASTHRVDQWFVAIGDNAAREQATERVRAIGGSLATAISRDARLSRTAVIDAGVVLMPGAIVNAATTIGAGAIVNTNASVDHDCTVGAFAHIAPGVAIAGGVTIGAGALVGIGARVLPGLTIGEGAVVGAGAVVVRDVAPWAVVAGVPARVRR